MKQKTLTRYTHSGMDCAILAKLPPVKSIRQAVDFLIEKRITGRRCVALGMVTSSLNRKIAKDGGMLIRVGKSGLFEGCGEISDEPDFARPLLTIPLAPFRDAPALLWTAERGVEENDVLRWIRDTFGIKNEAGCRFMLGRAISAGMIHFSHGMLCLGPRKKTSPASKRPPGRPRINAVAVEAAIRAAGGRVTRANVAGIASSSGCSARSVWSVFGRCKKSTPTEGQEKDEIAHSAA